MDSLAFWHANSNADNSHTAGVDAVEIWLQVAKVVAPKKAALKVAEDEYEGVMVGLRAKQAELKVGATCGLPKGTLGSA